MGAHHVRKMSFESANETVEQQLQRATVAGVREKGECRSGSGGIGEHSCRRTDRVLVPRLHPARRKRGADQRSCGLGVNS
jgi:hypothetical protein